MTRVARLPYTPLFVSYGLALTTGFFQAVVWGVVPIDGLRDLALPAAIISFVAWLGSIFWSFAISRTTGGLSLLGALPALPLVLFTALLMWACASGHGCI